MDRDRIVKDIKVNLSRKDAILAIKKDVADVNNLIEARVFYNELTSGEFIGLPSDCDTIMYLSVFCKWCEIEYQPRPRTKKEIEHDNDLKEAKEWFDGLSTREQELHYILLRENTPNLVAVG